MIFRALLVVILICAARSSYSQNLKEKQNALKDLIERTADLLPLDVPMGKLYSVNFREPLTLIYEIHSVRKIEGSDSLFLFKARDNKIKEIRTEPSMRQLKEIGVTFDYLIIHHKNYSWNTKPDTVGSFQITPAEYGYEDPITEKGISSEKFWYPFIDKILVVAFLVLIFVAAGLIAKFLFQTK